MIATLGRWTYPALVDSLPLGTKAPRIERAWHPVPLAHGPMMAEHSKIAAAEQAIAVRIGPTSMRHYVTWDQALNLVDPD